MEIRIVIEMKNAVNRNISSKNNR